MGAAKRAADLTRQLLAFSKRELLQPRPLRLEEAVDAEIRMLRRTLGEAISIEVAHQPNLPMVMADPGCLGQIVVNLAINARDAMPKGGRLSIMTRLVRVPDAAAAAAMHPLAKPGEFVQLSVADNGAGMPSEVVEHIFEPFFTTKDEGRGTGMGLAMVQALVQSVECAEKEVMVEFLAHEVELLEKKATSKKEIELFDKSGNLLGKIIL